MGGHTVPLAGIVPSAFRDLSATTRALIVASFAVLAALMLAALTAPASTSGILVRAELTFAALIGFILAVLSIRGSVGRVRAVRSWITLGLGLWLVRALVRDGVLLAGLDVSPVLTTLPSIGVLVCGGLAYVAALRGKLGGNEELTVYLDGAIIFFATAALILTTSAEAAGASVANAIYLGARDLLPRPVGRDSPAGPVRSRRTRAAWGVPDLGGNGPARGRIPAEAAISTTISLHEASSPAHLLIALGVVSVALGTATWTDAVDDHPGYAKFAARLRSLMPMAAVGLTALLMVVHVVRQLGGVVGVVNIVAIGLVLLTVAIRQSVLLSDREAAIRRELELGGKLSTAEGQYQSLVERQPGVVYMAEPGPTGRWHFVSPQLETMLGYTPEEWMADPELWARSIHPDDRDAVLVADAAAAEPGMPKRFEYRLVTRDDQVVWVLDDSTVTDGPDGQPVLQGLLVDITAAKLSEEALVASEEQQRMIIETASYAFVAIDGSGMVAEWNHAGRADLRMAACRGDRRRAGASSSSRRSSVQPTARACAGTPRRARDASCRDAWSWRRSIATATSSRWSSRSGRRRAVDGPFQRPHRRHHDSQGARGAASSPGAARFADRARQPGALHRSGPARARSGQRAARVLAGRPVPGSGRFQDDQRQPGPRGGRRAAGRRRHGLAAPCGRPTRPPGWVATSSPSCSRTRQPRHRRPWRGACSTRSTGPSPSRASRSRCTPASASRSTRRPRPRRRCSATPTSRCTWPSSAARAATSCSRNACTRRWCAGSR